MNAGRANRVESLTSAIVRPRRTAFGDRGHAAVTPRPVPPVTAAFFLAEPVPVRIKADGTEDLPELYLLEAHRW